VYLGRIRDMLVPGGVLFLAALAAAGVERIHHELAVAAAFWPFALVPLGVLVGWRFNRGRLVFGLLIILAADLFTPEGGAAHPHEVVALRAAWVLVPLNLATLSLLKERGIFTLAGLSKGVLIALQPLSLAAAFLARPEALFALSQRGWWLPPLGLPPLWLPGAAMLTLSAAVIFALFFRRRDPLDSGMFWAVVTVAMALWRREPPWMDAWLFGCAALILVAAGFESAHTLAFRDELTGLPARRALNEALLRMGGRYAVAMLDVDHFKRFNDRYGHEVGDQVLRMVGMMIAGVRRGKAFRYGGEEFTILFPGLTASEAEPILDELRRRIAARGFAVRSSDRPAKKPRKKRPAGSKKKVSVTVSIGVAEPGPGRSRPEAVVAAADKALYRAKNGGRNRVAAA